MSSCAVASDGSLLSPSKIHFYNDTNDFIPISGPLLVPPGPISVSTVVTMLDNHFTSQQRAIKLAGVCHMTCLSKPSAWVHDAAKALNTLATIGSKHKANNITPQHHVIHKINHPWSQHQWWWFWECQWWINQDHGWCQGVYRLWQWYWFSAGCVWPDQGDGGWWLQGKPKPLADTPLALNSWKANSSHIKLECTADLGTIFVQNAVETNPDSGNAERGHWCTICKYGFISSCLYSLLIVHAGTTGKMDLLENWHSSKVVCWHCEPTLPSMRSPFTFTWLLFIPFYWGMMITFKHIRSTVVNFKFPCTSVLSPSIVGFIEGVHI